MIEKLLRIIFSEKCQLECLQLDISEEYQSGPLHQCLSTNSSGSIPTHPRSKCITLRRLDVRLNSTCFLRDLIEYVPNLEQLSVQLISSLDIYLSHERQIEALGKSNENWFNKVRKTFFFI